MMYTSPVQSRPIIELAINNMLKTGLLFVWIEAIFSGGLGAVFSVLAQLFAGMDDSYTLGNLWFLGALSGLINS